LRNIELGTGDRGLTSDPHFTVPLLNLNRACRAKVPLLTNHVSLFIV